MSRIGKKAIALPDGVTVSVNGRAVDVSGPLGQLNWSVPEGIVVENDTAAKTVVVRQKEERKELSKFHGLSRALINNMVTGVKDGFQKKLEVYGTGYGADVKGGKLHLNCGFMGRGSKGVAQFQIEIPKGLTIDVEVAASRGDTEPAKFTIKGCDKQVVGQFAAEVRKIRPPEPYKGKGIRYHQEAIRRKQGKALAGGR